MQAHSPQANNLGGGGSHKEGGQRSPRPVTPGGWPGRHENKTAYGLKGSSLQRGTREMSGFRNRPERYFLNFTYKGKNYGTKSRLRAQNGTIIINKGSDMG